jgi:Rap1a immunity proteins
MHKPIFALAVAILATSITTVLADENSFTGNRVYPECKEFLESSSNHRLMQRVCLGLIEGVSEISSMKALRIGGRLCVPPNVTLGQKLRAVTKFMDELPEAWHLPFSALVQPALFYTWPCKV